MSHSVHDCTAVAVRVLRGPSGRGRGGGTNLVRFYLCITCSGNVMDCAQECRKCFVAVREVFAYLLHKIRYGVTPIVSIAPAICVAVVIVVVSVGVVPTF